MVKKINWAKFFVILFATEFIGFMGGFLSGRTDEVYAAMIKPPLAPPGWLFGIMWPLLYLLMSVAAYIVYQEYDSKGKRATGLYWIQLFVNFLWPIVFFRFQQYWLAVLIILLLDVLVIVTVYRFYAIKKSAAFFMLPYLAWILFATYLNVAIAVLN